MKLSVSVPHDRPHTHFFLEKRGFKIVGRKNVLYNNRIREHYTSIVDYKQIFQRNIKYFGPLTLTLLNSTDLPRTKDPLYHFLTFVQHIDYRLPPERYRGKFINSFFIPLVVLYEQYGDCDSKSVLLASLMATTPAALAPGSPGEKVALILVRGNGISHALLAIKRTPLHGMSSLYDIKKGYYIPLETTRPGWSPGFASRRVLDTIKSGFYHFVELN